MATSTKVQFRLEELRGAALEAIDERIKQAEFDLEEFDSHDIMTARIAEWREAQEARVADLFRRLGGKDIPDEELARFRVQDMPTNDTWVDRNRAKHHLRKLQAIRSQISAKAGSLVADKDGNVSLTSTQLEEFFGL